MLNVLCVLVLNAACNGAESKCVVYNSAKYVVCRAVTVLMMMMTREVVMGRKAKTRVLLLRWVVCLLAVIG